MYYQRARVAQAAYQAIHNGHEFAYTSFGAGTPMVIPHVTYDGGDPVRVYRS
jgi:hypothetical protein